MTRFLNRLTALKVARAKRPGMYADGGSLYLRVAPGGSKQWIFRYAGLDGRMRDMSIGPLHTIQSLAEARERATQARKLRLDGIDPIEAKHAQRLTQRGERTFTLKRGLRRALEHPWEHMREIERRLEAKP